MYFPSKKDLSYSFIFWAPICIFILMVLINGEKYRWNSLSDFSILGYFLAALLIVLIGFPLWIWVQTGYKIKEGKIKIKSGPLRKTIYIEEIKTLHTTKIPFLAISPYAAPALSSSRLEITYGKHNNVMNISPKNQTDFINMLVTKNPNIYIGKKIKQ